MRSSKPLILLWRGRRDSNSRPSRMDMRDVLTRTELQLKFGDKLFYESRSLFLFNLIFTSDGTGTVRVEFKKYQFPWSLGFSVLRTPLVMPFNPILEIVGGADVVAAVFEALKYVDMERHKQKSLSRL